jgi:hypothetical protein
MRRRTTQARDPLKNKFRHSISSRTSILLCDHFSHFPHSEKMSGVKRVKEGQNITLGCIFMNFGLGLYIQIFFSDCEMFKISMSTNSHC